MRNVFRLQKMIRSLFILTALLLCQIPSSKAQLTTPIPTDDGPYFESEFVRPQILEAYYSMFSKLPPNKDFAALFPPKPDILSAETRKSLRLIWSGSESSYAAELTATLFLTPADANSQNSAFSLDLIFEPSTEERQGTLLVKASESFKKGMKRGVVVKFPAEGRQDFFIDGTNNTDLIVSVLPETSTSPGAVGICPVELKGKVTASRGGNLVPVNYQLDDVEYHAAAKVEGTLHTGKNLGGYACASILTSRTIAPSDQYRDCSRSINPVVNVKYRTDSKTSDTLKELVLPTAGEIRSKLDLQTPGKFRRTQELSHRIEIHPFTPSELWEAHFWGRGFEVTPGGCFLVLKSSTFQESYWNREGDLVVSRAFFGPPEPL